MTYDSVLVTQLHHTFSQLMKQPQVPGVVHKAGHAYSPDT